MRRINPLPPRKFSGYAPFLLCLFLVILAIASQTAASTGDVKVATAARPGETNSVRGATAQTSAHLGGAWGQPITLKTVPIHISLLPDGRLLYWGRDKDNSPQKWERNDGCMTYAWDPTSPVASTLQIPNNTTNLFCSGHSFMPDGRLLVAGGHSVYEPTPDIEDIGETDVNIFDHVRNTWTLAGQMAKGRWYPFNVTLPSGETAIFSGRFWDRATLVRHRDRNRMEPATALNSTPEVYTKQGKLTQFADGPSIGMYPYLHIAPNGKVFIAGSSYFGTGASSYHFDPDGNGGQGAFSAIAGSKNIHNAGSSVLYDSVNGKVMLSGNASPDIKQLSVIDLTNAPQWRYPAAELNYGRKFSNATLLPDGKVLVTGGTQCPGWNSIDCTAGPATRPELWDPNTETFTVMAPNPSAAPRVYHSVAILLPDARVMVGGGGLPAARGEVVRRDDGTTETCVDNLDPLNNSVACRTFGHTDVEIFSPPYLFNADGNEAQRPVIQTAPSEVNYGQKFPITFGNSEGIQKVTWIRLPSVTHGFNQDQRINVLTFNPAGDGRLMVAAPSDPRQCPPGHYMMFAINSAGVPSVAKVVRISNDLPDVSSRVVRNANGRLELFYRGTDNQLYRVAQTTTDSGTAWAAPQSLQEQLAPAEPVAIANADGRIQVFWKDVGSALYTKWQLTPGGDAWSGAVSLGGGIALESSVVRNRDGRLQVFTRGLDNHIWYRTQTSANSAGFDAWKMLPLPGGIILMPQSVVNWDGRAQVFVVGTDNKVWYNTQLAANGVDNWSGWTLLDGISTGGRPTAIKNGDGRIQVFVRGFDNSVYTKWQVRAGDNSEWSPWGAPWQNMGMSILNRPAAGVDGSGRIQVFARYGADSSIVHRLQLSPDSSGLWQQIDFLPGANAKGEFISSPEVIRTADGRFEVFGRASSNGRIYHKWQTEAGGAWSPFWVSLGAPEAANF